MKKRIEELQKELNSNEAILITSDINRLYLTGFKSSAGAVVITRNNAILLIDFRYFEKAKREISHLEVCLCKRLYSEISDFLNKESIKDIYVETDSVTLDSLRNFKKYLDDFNISEDNKITEKITNMRAVKSDLEIANIEKAQIITDEAFSHILKFIKPGVTELEIALEMEFFMRKNGSEGTAFDFIVVSGKNSSLPHGVPTDKRIENGDFITMDFGGVQNGYRSDMTRTVAIGYVSEKQRGVYNTVLLAQKAALDAIKPEVECCGVDKAARDIIENAGCGKYFGHGTGHGVGLQIHESPRLSPKSRHILEIGDVVTVEPGIYIPDEFGVRIEDMAFITSDGCENLTKSPKSLIIL